MLSIFALYLSVFGVMGLSICALCLSVCRIGVMGLIEREWLATLATIEEEDCIYEDFVICARYRTYGLLSLSLK